MQGLSSPGAELVASPAGSVSEGPAPVFQVSDQLKPARPERLVLAVPVSAPNPANLGGCFQSTLQGKQIGLQPVQSTAAYSLLSVTRSLLRIHLARTARAHALDESSFCEGTVQEEQAVLCPREPRLLSGFV